ncbi:serine/threonine-protein kinase [Paraliomyxa miuraensis]|uniref:serine/threonine-protein kinase n=1 Tax=Paraliomyxa miuraensis TaxID=376150 RepID=UPI00225369CE|nr:serine/threonine-protein kinase [Paraliomyxa miuraensis]MCX4242701.1 serine/threonine protein kinase [Paraliomyxa miuraensis]
MSSPPRTHGDLGLPRPEPDTLEGKVFEARLEARLLGVEPQLPRIARFSIERKLGAGGMGTVYLAHDDELARDVALKLVRGTSELAGERMRLREARGLARIAHPNVITVFDVGEHEGRVWLAMEHVPGRTLRDCAAELPRQRVLELWIAAGRGLAAIHEAGLVHRDVKPDNVLLGDDGRVRVIDLGLVRAAATRDGERATTEPDPLASEVLMTPGFVGTHSYAAPEQRRCEPVDARADQYAFCVSLLESLCEAKPPAGREHEPLPVVLRDAIARGRDEDPTQRFPSMAELLDALERSTTSARDRRRRRALGLAVVGVGVLGGITAAFAWPRGDVPAPTPAPAPPSEAWSECMARAEPACEGQPSEVIELRVSCGGPGCDALRVEPSAALLVGERWPFDIVVDVRTPSAVELRWYGANDAASSGHGELAPGRHPLPPHWQLADIPVCIDVVDARDRVRSVVVEHTTACE